MNTRKINLLSQLSGAVLAAAFALPLHAGVSSSAVVDITNFTIGGSGLAFSSGQPVSTADVISELSGFPNSSLTGSTSSSLLDLATVCVGTCPQIGSNAFPVLTGAPAATFSTSDQYRSGSLLSGARIASGAYNAIQAGQKTSSADSNNNLNGTFVVGSSGPVTITFDARAYLESFVSAGEGFPGFSTAAYQVTFSIINLSGGGQTVFSWSPNGTVGGIVGGTETADAFTLNTTVSLNAPLPSDALVANPHLPGVASTGRFQAVTNDLVAGNLYQLSARIVTNADAQRVLTGLLGDRVWEDRNGNGIQDCADSNGNGLLGDAGDIGAECNAGVPNATVYLRTPDGDGNCTGSVLGSSVTDANGFYQFSGLPAGTYCAQFVPPTNYCAGGNAAFTAANQGADDAVDSDALMGGTTSPVSLLAGEINRTVDAGIYCPASLGDFVWNDTNQNGVQNAGEPGIQGVTVKLYACDGTELATTVTDINGFYGFTGLKPGSYYVGFTSPAGYVFTLLNQGGDPALDSDAQSNGQTACVALASGENNPTIDAGLYRPATAQLGDFVWHDLNANGVQDANEAGIPGATVTLFACNSTAALASTTTDAGGLYLFQNLAAGSYYVRFSRPTDYYPSPQDQGANDALDSDASQATGETACVSLAQGEINRTVDAGFYLPAALGDRVWNDANQNGIQENGEPGLQGVKVKLYTCDGSYLAETTTNASGLYAFSGLMPGSYYVEFESLTGYVFTAQDQGANDAVDSDVNSNGRTACVTLASGETNNTVDAGLYVPALSRLGDFVWNDLNADGTQNVGEPGIAGVKVTLFACNSTTPMASTTTSASGYYLFQNLMAGSYYVNFERPAAYPSSSPQNVGGDDAIDSDADLLTGNTACVTLGMDETNLTVDAGFYFPAAPAIDIEKATNGDDADFPTGPNITVGGLVTWTYVVTNIGNVPLSNVVVTDDKEGAICTIPSLAVGANHTCTKTGTAMLGQYANLGTATGTYMGTQVSDTDPSHYYGKMDSPGTGTPGYWMNHPEAWPVQSITIGGVTYSKMKAIQLMKAPTSTDVTYIMFQALVAAKLNVLIGNDASCIADTITAADAWMAKYGPVGSGVKGSSKAWKIGEPLYKKLDQYNNGLLCAPHRN